MIIAGMAIGIDDGVGWVLGVGRLGFRDFLRHRQETTPGVDAEEGRPAWPTCPDAVASFLVSAIPGLRPRRARLCFAESDEQLFPVSVSQLFYGCGGNANG